MAKSQFVYVTYIRTTPEKLWQALIDPEFITQYWFGMTQESAWEKGAVWAMKFPDGRTSDSGEVLEIDPPRKLVLKWRNDWKEELTAEGYSKMTYELVQQGDVMKLTILHEIDKPNSKLIEAVNGGWPKIMSNLKSFLETGSAIDIPNKK